MVSNPVNRSLKSHFLQNTSGGAEGPIKQDEKGWAAERYIC